MELSPRAFRQKTARKIENPFVGVGRVFPALPSKIVGYNFIWAVAMSLDWLVVVFSRRYATD